MMPKRWLSRRGRSQNTNPSSSHQDSQFSRSGFDFAFTGQSSFLQTSGDTFTALPRRNEDYDRPTTAGGIVEGRSRKKLTVDVSVARPQTSDGHRTSTRGLAETTSKSHEDLIGVAFGSPSHPPMTFGSMAGPLSPAAPNHAFRWAGPFPETTQRLQPKKWKMIGSLFKGRQASKQGKVAVSNSSSPAISQRQEFNKSNEHLPKQHWFKNKQPIPEQPNRAPPPIPLEITQADKSEVRKESEDSGHGKTMLLDPSPIPSPALEKEVQITQKRDTTKLVVRPTRVSSLPKLELDIPKSVSSTNNGKTGNSLATQQASNLLARRSKTLESLKSSDGHHKDSRSDGDEKPFSSTAKKRMSTPTMPKAPFIHTTTSSPTVSKYSLFPPAAPTPVKIVGRVPNTESPLKRSTSSPARMSPMTETFPKRKPVPNRTEQPNAPAPAEPSLTSPEDNTASTDHSAPWSTNHSVKSSVSSSTTMDEIFFDVKSFRDSKGMEDGQHFVMSRPDSTVVQIARTRSKLNAATRSHKQGEDGRSTVSKPQLPTKLAEYTDKHISVRTVNSAIFDAAIAEVEALTCPSTVHLPLTSIKAIEKKVHDLTKDTSPSRNHQSTDTSMKLLPPDPVLPGRQASKSRKNNTAQAIPSPIIEEASPSSTKTLTLHQSPEKPKDPVAASRKAVETSAAVQKAREKAAIAAAKATGETEIGSKVLEDAALTRVKMIKRVDTPVEDSPTIPQSPPPRKPGTVTAGNSPPPVPEKDAKFIPISKFAAKHTVAKVEEVGVRPARLGRAATDVLPTSQSRGQAVSRTARSDTVPKPSHATQLVRPSPQATKSDFAAHNQLKDSEKGTVQAVIIHAKPAAEVSVARTVSLQRKQSARVTVPGPKLLARRAEEEEKKKGLGLDSVTTSAVGTPIIGVETPRLEGTESTLSTPQLKPGPLNSNPSTGTFETFAQRAEKQKEKEQEKAKQEKIDRELIEKFKEQDKSKWDLGEQRALSPVVVEGQRGHKPGLSMNLVFETA